MAILRKEPRLPNPPEDLRNAGLCPVCGFTKLAGVMKEDNGWLVCTECRCVIPDKPATRAMLRTDRPLG